MIWIHLLKSKDAAITVNEDEDIFLPGCITAISKRYFSPGRTVMISSSNNIKLEILDSLHLLHTWPIVIARPPDIIPQVNPENWDESNDDKHGGYVVMATDQQDLTSQIIYLRTLAAWNSRARFIVILENGASQYAEVLQQLWQLKLMNSVMLVQEPNTESIKVYSFYGYGGYRGTCDRPYCRLVNQCIVLNGQTQLSTNKIIFPDKVPKDMCGWTFQVAAGHIPPYVILRELSKEISAVEDTDGLEMNLLKSVGQAMNISVTVLQNSDEFPWGIKTENGTWTGIRGDILYGRSDAGVDSWVYSVLENSLSDITFSYYMGRFTIFVPPPKQRPVWLVTARVFDMKTWFSILFSLMFSGVLSYLLAKNSNESSRSYGSVIGSSVSAFQILLGISVGHLPKSNILRVFVSSWIIYSYFVNMVFQIYVTSLFVNPGFEFPIDDFDDLAESGIVLAFEDFYDNFLGDEILQRFSKRQACDSPASCYRFAVSGPQRAVLTSRDFFASFVEMFGMNNPLQPFKEDTLQLSIIMSMQKGHPLLGRMNEILMRHVEGGFPNKFMKDLLENKNRKNKVSIGSTSPIDYVVMTLSHLQSAFILMCLGILLSGGVLLVEIIVQLSKQLVLNAKSCKSDLIHESMTR